MFSLNYLYSLRYDDRRTLEYYKDCGQLQRDLFIIQMEKSLLFLNAAISPNWVLVVSAYLFRNVYIINGIFIFSNYYSRVSLIRC